MALWRRQAAVKAGRGVAACDQKDSNVLLNTKAVACLLPCQGRVAKKKEHCLICFEDIDFALMFYVDRCGHRFCTDCMKKYIGVKLLDGKIPDCPHQCKSWLSIDSCGELLTLKQSLMWIERIKEYSIPPTERVYCPYDSCSYLMSKTELSRFGSSPITNHLGLRRCLKCGGNFCVNCKVPWHSKQSCHRYNKEKDGDAKLKYLANLNGWRQCPKCQHMVELSYGCNHITCRCGSSFCYKCGSLWNGAFHRDCNGAFHRDCNGNEWIVGYIGAFFIVIIVLIVVLCYPDRCYPDRCYPDR